MQHYPCHALARQAPNSPSFTQWCGHCRNLREDIDSVATWVTEHEAPIALARVDVNEYEELADRFGFKFFPVFMLGNSGELERFPTLNNGKAITTRLAQQLGMPAPPPYRAIDSMEDAVTWLFWRGTDGGIMETALVADLRDASDAQLAALEGAATDLVESLRFGEITNAEISEAFSFPAPPALALYKDFDEGKVFYEGEWTAEGIKTFVQQQRVPLAFYVTHWNLDAMRSLPQGVFVHVFVEAKRVENGTFYQPLRHALLDEALKLEAALGLPRGIFSFMITDGEKYRGWKSRFGVEAADLPAVGVLNKVEDKRTGGAFAGDADDVEGLARFTVDTALPSILAAARSLGYEVNADAAAAAAAGSSSGASPSDSEL